MAHDFLIVFYGFSIGFTVRSILVPFLGPGLPWINWAGLFILIVCLALALSDPVTFGW